MRSLFSDTYSGLFSLMVDKSNSNGSDKGTEMLVITLGQFHTHTLQKKFCYQVFTHLSKSYSCWKNVLSRVEVLFLCILGVVY